MKFDFKGGRRFKPMDGSYCYWSGCGEPPVADGLCAEHAAGCKCRSTEEFPSSHFPGEGCDDKLDANGICSVCVEECLPVDPSDPTRGPKP